MSDRQREQSPQTSARPGWFGSGARPLRVLLLRHGQTPMSVAGVFSGRSDPELTALGHAQAERAASWLRVRQDAGEGIDAVYTSPLVRARQTADAVAEELGIEPVTTPDLIETDFGVWEGLEFDEVHRRWPTEHADWAADPSVSAVGGESMDAVAARCGRLIGSLERSGGDGGTWQGRTVLLVSHVSPIKAILRTALEAPATVYSTLHLDLAGLSVAEFYPDRSVVREVNDTHYLQGL
ncbi:MULTISPECIES: histidine phosphatase family protein [Corynebacterium]|uniref:Phosphoserine phosphatase 1 n=1 Tax=Corynebacterium provencense TaxID=1737425 RepID=A0A2Z3YYV3_9CORY|nr:MULTISPECIES: histidine phosphatase family protein [Corynebacterium]AWT26503.1 Phosphoserine phosphatase 1 [Corynebacterium provencense]MCI1257557.1 histidine phosphatase family protein [Corynebacterium provencense]